MDGYIGNMHTVRLQLVPVLLQVLVVVAQVPHITICICSVSLAPPKGCCGEVCLVPFEYAVALFLQRLCPHVQSTAEYHVVIFNHVSESLRVGFGELLCPIIRVTPRWLTWPDLADDGVDRLRVLRATWTHVAYNRVTVKWQRCV